MEDKEISVMNVVPLIDIMLVLLAIVLVTSTFIASGRIPLELPKAKTAMKMQNTLQEFVEIDESENIRFQNKNLSLEELAISLEKVSPDLQIIIRADKKVSLNVFVEVMDTLKEHGFQNVSLQTKK